MTAVRGLAMLLIPAPVLTLAYLWAIRSFLLPPRFVPIMIAAGLPVWVLGRVVATTAGSRRARMILASIAVAELAWCLFAAAAVGMAIGLRSG